jgi:cyclic pyranopterin phosphate synthase
MSAPVLIDGFGRRIDYLRVSVTDRCDLRCTYCLPEGFKGFEEPAHWLNHAQMARLVRLFVGLGVAKVRLTGGEPLLRRGLTTLVRDIAAIPNLRDLSLSTNATQLTRHALALKQAGVQRLNVSLDTLSKTCFASITGRDKLDQVLAGLAAAREAGFAPIKLNMVVQAGINEHDVSTMVHYALENGFVLRLIETMPIGATGQAAAYLDLSALGARIAAEFGLHAESNSGKRAPARYWRDAAGQLSFGVITPVSQHFCAACNRVRLGVDGTLYLCLGQNDKLELGRMLRAGADDAMLSAAIIDAIARKPERHHFNETPDQVVRFMSQTGG